MPAAVGGLVAGGLVAEDRRSVGTQADDQAIEIKALNRIAEAFKGKHHINVTSYNKQVLLTGEAPTEQDKAGIEAVVRGVEYATQVQNEIVVMPNTELGSRSNDTLITGKVKTRFVSSGRGAFSPNHVKVVTENGVVYLMGLVTKEEGDAAANIAASTGGVTRVVKVFEYRPAAAVAPAGATRTDAGAAPANVAPAPAVPAPAPLPVPAQVPATTPGYTPPDAPIQPPPQAPAPVPIPKS
ncbi:MAG: BON domain-containing protein [Burkholderiales bacterium]